MTIEEKLELAVKAFESWRGVKLSKYQKDILRLCIEAGENGGRVYICMPRYQGRRLLLQAIQVMKENSII